MHIPLPVGAVTTNISAFVNARPYIPGPQPQLVPANLTNFNATPAISMITAKAFKQATASLSAFLSQLPRGSDSRPEIHLTSPANTRPVIQTAAAATSAVANGEGDDLMNYIRDLCSGRADECGHYMHIFTAHSSVEAPMAQSSFVEAVIQKEAGAAALQKKKKKKKKRSIADETGEKGATPVTEEGDELANPGVIHPGDLLNSPPAMGQPAYMVGEKCMINKPLAPPKGGKAMQEGRGKRDLAETSGKVDGKIEEWAAALWGGFVSWVLV